MCVKILTLLSAAGRWKKVQTDFYASVCGPPSVGQHPPGGEKRSRPTFTPLSAVRPRSVKTHQEVEKGSDRLLRHCPRSTPGQKATGAASLTVGGHMTGYVTWQSALGHKATGAASPTVGGHLMCSLS